MTAMRMTATSERLPVAGRLLRAGSVLLGALATLFVVTVPLSGEQQAVLTLLGIGAFLLVNRSKSRRATVLLVLEELGEVDGPVVAMAFGPGLTLYAALLLPA